MTARVRYYAVTLLLFVALLSSSTQVAFAYVDPGTGLLAFQSASAFVTGLLFYFRRRLKLLFLKQRSSRTGIETMNKPEGSF